MAVFWDVVTKQHYYKRERSNSTQLARKRVSIRQWQQLLSAKSTRREMRLLMVREVCRTGLFSASGSSFLSRRQSDDAVSSSRAHQLTAKCLFMIVGHYDDPIALDRYGVKD